jgi:hypothetical protein
MDFRPSGKKSDQLLEESDPVTKNEATRIIGTGYTGDMLFYL